MDPTPFASGARPEPHGGASSIDGSPPDRARLSAKVIEADALSESELSAWRHALDARPRTSSPFLSPDFLLAAARYRPHARALVVERDGRPVAFAMFERAAPGVAGPVAPRMNEAQGFVIAAGEADLQHRDLTQILRDAGLNVFGFTAVGSDCPLPAGSIERCALDYVVDLDEGFETYLERKRIERRNLVRNFRYGLGKLERDCGAVTFLARDDDPDAFASLMSWKGAQLERAGYLDVLKACWAREMIEDMRARPTPRFEVLVSTLRAGGRIVGALLNLRDGAVLQGWMMAYDPEFGRYGPGVAMLFLAAEAAADEGVTTFRLGAGGQAYKERLATRSIEMRGGAAAIGPFAKGLVGAARAIERVGAGTALERAALLPRRAWRKFEEIRAFGA